MIVVDASVVVKWFLPEAASDAALVLLERTDTFAAPDLLFAEVANAVWKRVRKGELDRPTGAALIADVVSASVQTIPARDLVRDALGVAIGAGISVYDATYIVLAVRLRTELVTADVRLHRTVSALPGLARYVRLIKTARSV